MRDSCLLVAVEYTPTEFPIPPVVHMLGASPFVASVCVQFLEPPIGFLRQSCRLFHTVLLCAQEPGVLLCAAPQPLPQDDTNWTTAELRKLGT